MIQDLLAREWDVRLAVARRIVANGPKGLVVSIGSSGSICVMDATRRASLTAREYGLGKQRWLYRTMRDTAENLKHELARCNP